MKLPKIYLSTSEKFKKFDGLPKLSYSQYSSWNTEEYRAAYILEYIFGIKQETNVFATYGGQVGAYIEAKGTGKTLTEEEMSMLSIEDKSFLDSMEYPPNCTYEEEIVLLVECNEGTFCIQGFMDRAQYFEENRVCVTDFKTGNADKKVDYYAAESFGQTTLYCKQKADEGYEVECSNVLLLGRKGNARPGHPIRLSGQFIPVPTEYSEERALKLIEEFKRTAKEISSLMLLVERINS